MGSYEEGGKGPLPPSIGQHQQHEHQQNQPHQQGASNNPNTNNGYVSENNNIISNDNSSTTRTVYNDDGDKRYQQQQQQQQLQQQLQRDSTTIHHSDPMAPNTSTTITTTTPNTIVHEPTAAASTTSRRPLILITESAAQHSNTSTHEPARTMRTSMGRNGSAGEIDTFAKGEESADVAMSPSRGQRHRVVVKDKQQQHQAFVESSTTTSGADHHHHQQQQQQQQQQQTRINDGDDSDFGQRPETEVLAEREQKEAAYESTKKENKQNKQDEEVQEEEGHFEIVDGIKYKIIAAVTKPPSKQVSRRAKTGSGGSDRFLSSTGRHSFRLSNKGVKNEEIIMEDDDDDDDDDDQTGVDENDQDNNRGGGGLQSRGGSEKLQQQHRWRQQAPRATLSSSRLNSQSARTSGNPDNDQTTTGLGSRFNNIRRKSTALMTSLIHSSLSASDREDSGGLSAPRRRLSIYEMTKSPPPETSLEIYLNERRRSSNISAKQVQQTLEQKSTFQVNYNQRQQYFNDLNAKLINQDRKLLNVVANRGQIHRHSVDIAQLPLSLALAKARGGVHQAAAAAAAAAATSTTGQSGSGSGSTADPNQASTTAIDQVGASGQLQQQRSLQLPTNTASGGLRKGSMSKLSGARRPSRSARLLSTFSRTRSISIHSSHPRLRRDHSK